MLDAHCHLLPGVDDGKPTLRTSLDLLGAAAEQGITRIVATPHVRHVHENVNLIIRAYEELLPFAQHFGIQMHLGFECSLQAFESQFVHQAQRFCIQSTRLLLLRLPDEQWPVKWRDTLQALLDTGVDLLLAHPECCRPIQRDPGLLEELNKMGCSFQINAMSLRGIFGRTTAIARLIQKNGWPYVLGTNASKTADYHGYARVFAHLKDAKCEGYLENAVCEEKKACAYS